MTILVKSLDDLKITEETRNWTEETADWQIISTGDHLKKYFSEDIKLSDAFINRYSNKLDWNGLAIFYDLPEHLIEEHVEKVDWGLICTHQNLSEAFVERNASLIDWVALVKDNEKISKEIKEMHKAKADSWIE